MSVATGLVLLGIVLIAISFSRCFDINTKKQKAMMLIGLVLGLILLTSGHKLDPSTQNKKDQNVEGVIVNIHSVVP